LIVTAPLEPDDVCKTSELPESALDVVILPLAVNVSVPAVDVTVPDVPMLAEAPVVVTENAPFTVDVPSVRATALERKAVDALTVIEPVDVVTGVPTDPILPVAVRLSVPPEVIGVTEFVILAEPPVVVITKSPPTDEA